MHDSGVGAPIVAGDAGELTEAYDKYADPLYKYCRFLLSDTGDAADAVQDTFVIAAAKLAGPRDAAHPRAWLYAVARDEALRIARAANAVSAPAAPPDAADEPADDDNGGERAELRRLLGSAAGGLDPAEREAIELQLRHGLAPAEIALVLGASRGRAQSLLSRARDQLEACLGALLVGRAGRGDCAELGAMLAGWDGRLTVALRKRMHRHIERCATCAGQRAAQLRPAMLLGLSPGAAMAAAAADSLRAAAGPPAELRAHTLALAAGQDASAVAHRAAVLGRAGASGPQRGSGAPGWGGRGLRGGRRRAAVAAGAVLAVLIGAVAVSLTQDTEHAKLADGKLPGSAASPGTAAAPGPVAPAPGNASGGATPSHTASRLAAAPAPTTAPALLSPTSAPPAATPTPAQAPTTAGPAPTAPRSPTPAPATASPTRTPTPASGTLRVFPPGGVLWVPPWGTAIYLRAQGGPVTWWATVSQGPGSVSVRPSSGTLADNAVTAVTITASQSAGGQLVTVYPGGAAFTIMVNRGPHP